jgi:hypothetical protein
VSILNLNIYYMNILNLYKYYINILHNTLHDYPSQLMLHEYS